MFTRSMCRTAAPLRRSAHGIRGYASQSPSSGGGIGTFGFLGIAAVAGGAGYYYYANVEGKAPPIPTTIAKARADAPKAFKGGDQDFLPLKLESTEDISHNTKKFIFALPEKDQVAGLPIASALITKFKKEGEKPTIRPYTPTSDVDAVGKLELIVKEYPGGAMSQHIHSLKPGDTLDIKGPIPKYEVTPNKHSHIAMICGGTGITPMYQVMQGIFKNPEDKTKVTLVFGNISEEDILLKDKFDELENTYPQRFRAFYTLDKPPSEWAKGKGFINKDLLKTVLPEPKEENIKIFICGPPGLYKAISGTKPNPKEQGELTGILKELGYDKDQVFKF